MKLHIKNSISTLSAAVLIVASTVTGSCTDDFDNINRDNNVPTSGNFSLQLNAQLRSITFGQFDFNNGALLAHQIGKTNYNEIAQYSFGTAEYLWNSLYQNLVNIDDMINMAKKQEQPSAEAIGYILKAFCSSQLTDHWGNVPYSEAMQGSKNVYPKYDEQQDIYTGEEGIIRLLQRADVLLATSKDQLPSDIIYEGNRMKWRKLANSLRLRYLIRISNRMHDVRVFDVKTQIADCMSKPLMESNEDNFQLKFLSDASNRCPIFNLRSGEFEVIRMSKELADAMNAHNDPRKHVWFQPTPNSAASGKPIYDGVPNGCSSTTLQELNITQNNLSELGKIFTRPDAVYAVVMNAAEVKFLQAEAIARKWAVGDAGKLYTEGITLSMRQWQIGDSDIQSYLNNPQNKYQSSKSLEMIMKEKWLANFLVGYEGWYDFKRTGLPKQKMPMDNRNPGGASQIPSRFYYPEAEQAVNKQQYDAAIQAQGGTDNTNTKLWWE
ncbi:hypothetical protein HMPREF0645_1376 [Hallella bergensis DSM 17361]|uniref:SusD/RagB family nutrient-binding outer membrane lipoprotein n=1 Tax=Hallella bergensis DSM 17361 TaxID=585502 RepID=D1PWP1_9BACT|nr:SusD/RagB family nutrient-binding outer membrane lipoprotein [Hallella bergensis]EFA44222.1 hypothetical protein HMPREF0645_1376 [Hallella bergensis DSM 17361]